MKHRKCIFCDQAITKKDVVALNQKLLGVDTVQYYCIPCLAEVMDDDEEDLYRMIDRFKEDGCVLFS